AGTGAMNGMEFNLVEAFPQFVSPAVVNPAPWTLWPGHAPNNPAHQKARSHQHHIATGGMMTRLGRCDAAKAPGYRLADDAAPAAILVSAGVAAILTSTSL